LLARTLATLDRPPTVFLSGSAIGIYGDRGDEELDESATGEGLLAGVCRAWKAATEPASATGIRCTHLRTGIVLSAESGRWRSSCRCSSSRSADASGRAVSGRVGSASTTRSG
jgi:hypothetical protein